MYQENPEGTQVIVGSMNFFYKKQINRAFKQLSFFYILQTIKLKLNTPVF